METTTNALTDLRAEDLAVMYDHSFTKLKAVETGNQLVADVFEAGLVDPLRVFSNVIRLSCVIESAVKAFRARLQLDRTDSYNGVTFTPKNGSEKLNYSEDPVYADLEGKLKARAALVKLATKSRDTIFDSEGCEVPRVSSTFDKASITVSF